MLPKILKDMILSVDGRGYAGQANITQTPKLARKMEEYWAGGMSGPVEIDLGSEKLEMEWEAFGVDKDTLKLYGATGVAGIGFRFNGSIERDDDTCSSSALEIQCRGRITEIDTGGYKSGDQHTVKYKASLSSVKIKIDDEDIVEIDNANYSFKVGGEDKLAERRRNLKL